MAYYDDRHYYPTRDRYDRRYDDYYPESRLTHGGSSRRNASDDSIEEVPRAYPPGSRRYEYNYDDYDYDYPPRYSRGGNAGPEGVRRSHSMAGRDRNPNSADEYYHPRRYRRSRRDRDRDDRRHRRYSRSPSSSRSPPPRRERRRKSFSEQALGALGLGSAASAAESRHGGRDRGRSSSRAGRHRRSYSYSPSPGRGRSSKKKTEEKMAQAARAAVIAGAVEAFRMRKEPGEWKGDKGKRILTSAITAAGTDGIVDKDPNKHGTRHVIESTLAGLATNRLVNGSRSRSRHGRSKSRGRSDSHGAAKGLAATGLLAAAGKEAYDRYQSRSKPRRRSDSRGRSSSRSDDSRERGSKRRSKSVSDYINKGLAALGLEEGGKDDKRRSRRSGRSESESEEESDYSPPPRYERRRGRDSRDVGRSKPLNERALATSGAEGKEGRERGCSCSESDLGNSTDDEGKRKKMRRSTMLASGLATVATIHAAHEVYSGAERRKKRAEMVREGKMTEEEARKSRIKNNITDAAAIGVAALGVKGAYGEWKEVNEKRKETNNFKRECEERAQKRHQRARSQSAAAPRSNNRPRLPDEIEDPDGRRVRYYDDSYYGLQSPSVERDRIYY